MNRERGPLATGALLGLALALILASHEVNRQEGWSVFGVYIYWFCRIGMAYLIIVGAYAALGQALPARSSPYAHLGLATALSYPPFVLAVTSMDLLIGDASLLEAQPGSLMTQVGLQAAGLIDNHLTTSALLLTPYLRDALRPAPSRPIASYAPSAPPKDEAAPPAAEPQPVAPPEPPEAPGLLLSAQPPILGDLIAAEAQEHYVKIKATEQGGMALYRFGDAVRDLGRYQGMQVHRSHWVADAAVAAVVGRRGSMKLELSTGEVIPVSRRYEIDVESRYADRERRAE